MQLLVSTEVEPGVFDEAVLEDVGGHVSHRVHLGWLTVECEADRVGDLGRQRGVVATLPLPACDDRLDQLPPGLAWAPLADADAAKLVAFRLETGRIAGRIQVLRLTATALQPCFVRCHRTAAIDMAVVRRSATAPGGRVVLARHSDGLRDESAAGMHDWPAGTVRSIVMWVGHLPPGEAVVESGFPGGWIRVAGRPVPFAFTSPLILG